MSLESRRYADVTVAVPSGRIDHEAAGPLERSISSLLEPDVSPAALLLDFGRVEYISSVGLRVLMIAAKSMRARKARIAVASLTPTVAEIFTISRFDAVVEVFPGLREALAALSPAALAACEAEAARGRR